MRPKIAIFSDLDGTLLDDQRRLHRKDAVLLEAGHPDAMIVIASGRPLHSIRRTLHQVGLFTERPVGVPVVSHNGAAVYDTGEKLCAEVQFDPGVQSTLIASLAGLEGATVLLQTHDLNYALRITPFGAEQAALYGFDVLPVEAAADGQRFCKVMCLSEDPNTLSKAHEWVGGLPVEAAYSMPIIIEITPTGVNKHSGARLLLEKLCLSGVPIFAAGDGGNDLPLLQAADRSFSPSNAPAAIQATSDIVVDRRSEGMLTPILRNAGLI